jgi:hypothetical protein
MHGIITDIQWYLTVPLLSQFVFFGAFVTWSIAFRYLNSSLMFLNQQTWATTFIFNFNYIGITFFFLAFLGYNVWFFVAFRMLEAD